ncbi:AraC family transcriptional regulator [Methyloceanibacter sp. wino2]|uniref:AraC family transcriptional regulator n=1 Tax=Methyloceanibacter sp. wino2 TaxID=2170729 RepID=UPI000D3ED3F3|nr:AraC family transcriptional regulator [Methyloceanibacter sp. wino2]
MAPLTRPTSFAPLRKLLVAWESEQALQKAFQEESLPLVTTERSDLFVPTTALVGVFERAARATGRRDFGFRVGEQLQHQSFGLWSQYCAQGATLADALRRLGDTLAFHQSGARFSIERNGSMAVWRYRRSQSPNVHKQHSDYTIPPLLSLLRFYLGADWLPSRIELDYPRDADARVIETLMAVPVQFAQPTLGIAIPLELLSRKRPYWIGKPITDIDVAVADALQITHEPLRSILAISILRLMDGKTDIEGTAAMAEISVRTLQRYLNREGLSYRDLLERVRLRRARALLEQTDVSITEIALSLGYSEHANFTRAFRRSTGLTPAEFRHHMGRIGLRKNSS